MAKQLRSPGFLGIGVMKGGSSWAWRQLKSHPDVGVPNKKEMHFIDRLNITLKDYRAKFGKMRSKVVGEYTPNYICCPYAPQFVKTHFPNSKLFTILRNPTDRAFSHYKDHLYYGKIPSGVGFLEAFKKDYPQKESSCYSIRAKGMYGDQVELWQKFFGPDQFKIFYYDDLVADPVRFLQNLYRWIEVSEYIPSDYKEKVVKKYNLAYDDMKLDAKDRQFVADYYQVQIEKLESLTSRKTGWLLTP